MLVVLRFVVFKSADVFSLRRVFCHAATDVIWIFVSVTVTADMEMRQVRLSNRATASNMLLT